MVVRTPEEYFNVLDLNSKKIPGRQISRLLNIPQPTVQTWLSDKQKPRAISEKRKIADENNRKQLKTSSFQLSPELAYILGVIEGDGCCSEFSVELETIDYDFAIYFQNMLEKWSGLKCGKMSFGKRFNTYKARLHSVKASYFIKNFDLNMLLNADVKTIGMFIKGFFDSEGTISSKKYTIRAFNTNFDTIKFVEKLLLKIGILPSNKYYPRIPKTNGGKGSKLVYSICIYNKNNFRIFKKLAGFSIKRKMDALEKICG